MADPGTCIADAAGTVSDDARLPSPPLGDRRDNVEKSKSLLNHADDSNDKIEQPLAKRKKKNRPGRSARRRKAKARSILAAATHGEECGGISHGQGEKVVPMGVDAAEGPCGLPSDRHRPLPGALMRRAEARRCRSRAGDEETEEADGAHNGGNVDLAFPDLDPSDAAALLRQLGFVPGNAVCVAARERSSSSSNDDDGVTGPTIVSSEEGNDNAKEKCVRRQIAERPTPTVLKLYPLAIRDAYAGGRSDGRKFKGRRRCGNTAGTTIVEPASAAPQTENGADDAAMTDAAASKPSRDWTVPPAAGDDGDANGEKGGTIEPFPTLYWLTDPALRIAVSRLELSKTHNVKCMEGKLRASPVDLAKMERAHASYGRDRWALLTDDDKDAVMRRGWESALSSGRGVAGIRRVDAVKCLHAHAAHYLAQREEEERERRRRVDEGRGSGDDGDGDGDGNDDDENVVGRWVMEAVHRLAAGEEVD